MPDFDDDVWELYAPGDWTQAHDISAEDPAQLHRLQQLFVLEARSTTCSRSTTAGWSASTRRRPVDRLSSKATARSSSGAWAG